MALPGGSVGRTAKFLIAMAALFLLGGTLEQPAHAGARVALVIGNSAYNHQPLANPANDAALMADTLRQVGFQVHEHINADARTMRRAFREFSRAVIAAGEDTVGLVYYAGHGIQAKGENYMIPIGAQIEDSLDVEFEGVPASNMLSSLEHAGNRLNIVILDACRNNPYRSATRSSGSGLARMDAPSGTLIAYSTGPGKVAADGRDRNSPYTRALSRAIMTPGAKVEDVFKTVRVSVMDRTAGEQVPWESSSLTGDFYFLEESPEPVALPEPPSPQPPDNTVEITFWNSIKDSTDPALFESYLGQYPEGLFAVLARTKVESLKRTAGQEAERAFFQAVQGSNNKSDFEAYLSQWPNGVFAELAKARIASLEVAASQAAAAQASAKQEPEQDLDTDHWNEVKDSGDAAVLQTYLDRFPNGKFAPIAAARIAGLKEQQQVAALTPSPSGHPMDGNWKVRWDVIGQYNAIGFCQAGEFGEKVVQVRNGEFKASIGSNRGGAGKLVGSISEAGKLRMRYSANNGLSPDRASIDVSSGEGSTDRRFTNYCHARFTVVRVQ